MRDTDVKAHNNAYKKNLTKEMRKLDKSYNVDCGVGYDEMETHPLYNGRTDSIDMATLAKILHYGVPSMNIPARPFMTYWLDHTDAKKHIKSIAMRGVSDKKFNPYEVCYEMEKAIQITIKNEMFTPNAQSTIESKGFDFPLIEYGWHIFEDMDYDVRKKK